MNLYSDYSNLALLTDFYELTMMQGYYFYKKNTKVVFDMFFRRQPFSGGYVIFAGLEPLIKAILNLKFTDEEISYLEKQKIFRQEFLDYLSKFQFTGSIYSVEEGEVVFPIEPLIRVHSNIIEAQLLESMLLNIINFQSLIATKTSRIKEASSQKVILEFGLRRAQGIDGAISAARSAYIGGAEATSNVLAGKIFNISPKGTMAHSWIMTFEKELSAFKKYAELYPENCILLVDTYNTLQSGVPNAIKIFKKLKKLGIKNYGIRLDSGDLEYLSKEARKMLDDAGFPEAKIIVSNELDEYIIEQLINKKAPIDMFGVGTNLVTAKDDPSLTGVYKIVAKKEKKTYKPCIKISDNIEKTTNPQIKNILRLYDKDNFMIGDLICLEKEVDDIKQCINKNLPILFYHPDYNYKSIKISNYKNYRFLLKEIIKDGKLNYKFPSLDEIQKKTKYNISQLHPTYKRLLNPHIYKISISEKLKNLKFKLIKKYKG